MISNRMAAKSWRPLLIASLFLIHVVPNGSLARVDEQVVSNDGKLPKPTTLIARLWHGRTKATQAEEYYAYLYGDGIKKMRTIEGNVGIQVFRRNIDDVTEFTVISYWESRDAIRKFAGQDIEKTHNLPRDHEYLLELEPTVTHYEVAINDWKR